MNELTNEINYTLKKCDKCGNSQIPVGIQYYASSQGEDAYASVFVQCTNSTCDNSHLSQEIKIQY